MIIFLALVQLKELFILMGGKHHSYLSAECPTPQFVALSDRSNGPLDERRII
jgi:hypothetical protein